jgi:flagellar biosynthesis GTPase FlhF
MLRKFYAETMQDALEQVQRACGDEAIILDTRVTREEDGRERVELWVELGEGARPAPPPSPADGPPPEAVDDVMQYVQALQDEVREVHTRLAGLSTGMGWLGASPWEASGELGDLLADGLARKLPVSGGVQAQPGRRAAFIGPTGVGKTTLISRLLWSLAAPAVAPVGVLSLDTWKFGGIEPLRRVCARLDVPLEVAYTPDDVPGALDVLAGRLVLIDTAGVNPRDPAALAELQALLAEAAPDEVHLVVSAGASAVAVRETLTRLAVVQPEQFAITKLDETPALLEVLPLFVGTGMALSYLTAGARVTDVLTPATAEIITRCCTGE